VLRLEVKRRGGEHRGGGKGICEELGKRLLLGSSGGVHVDLGKKKGNGKRPKVSKKGSNRARRQ